MLTWGGARFQALAACGRAQLLAGHQMRTARLMATGWGPLPIPSPVMLPNLHFFLEGRYYAP